MKTKHPLFITALLAFVALAITGCTGSIPTDTGSGDIPITPSGQAVTLLSDEQGQYVPAIIRVQRGSTVRIIGDTETLVGGMDTVVIDGYGIRKTIAPGDNVIEFVADKPGTYEMICANGMGNGQLIVE
jgi:plastocyanin domain-containing protein